MERGFQIQPFDENFLPQIVEWVRPLWAMVDWESSASTVDWEGSGAAVDVPGGCGPLDVEFIVRHNIFRNEFALQLTGERAGGGEELLAVAFAARLGEQNDSLQWLESRIHGLSGGVADGLQLVMDYLEDMDRRTCRQMTEEDIRLTLFASSQPGCGRLILAELERRLRRSGFKALYLWTDSDCNHRWYPAHGFTLVKQSRSEAFSTPQRDFLTYVFRKGL